MFHLGKRLGLLVLRKKIFLSLLKNMMTKVTTQRNLRIKVLAKSKSQFHLSRNLSISITSMILRKN